MRNLLYEIGLTFLPGVGDVLAKNLLQYCGSAEAVFHTKKAVLQKIPGIGPATAKLIVEQKEVLTRAEQELRFIERYRIQVYTWSDESYPKRLKNCVDAPIVLYYKGERELPLLRMLTIVGTRKMTDYGKQLCSILIEELRSYDVCIVSGLAYGVDICAHRESLRHQMSTIAVLGHGLDRIYPAAHRASAEKMLLNGGLLTEFPSLTQPDRENFPRRNRIVAGISDATVLIEAAENGGAIITAVIANSYNRDVFAFPGRVGDTYSGGCNLLIKSNRAELVTGAADIVQSLGWNDPIASPKELQRVLPIGLESFEQELFSLLDNYGPLGMDDILLKTGSSLSTLASTLLTLELKGYVQALPGKTYRIIA